MKIIGLSIQNYLGIAAFKVDKFGKLNLVEGGNGVGKSAIVKAIREAFISSGRDPDLVRVDQEEADIRVDLDNGVSIERQITCKSNQVKVVDNGEPVSKPQTYLNDLIGLNAFNPVDFFKADTKTRRKILLSSIPFELKQEGLKAALGDQADLVDLSQFDYTLHGLELLEQIQELIYERRKEENQGLTRLTKALEQDRLDVPPTFDGEKFVGFNIQDAIAKLGDSKVACADHRQDQENLATHNRAVSEAKSDLEELQAILKLLEDETATLTERVQAFEDPEVDKLQAVVDEYNESQELVQKVKAIKRKERDIEVATEIHGRLDRLHKALTTSVPRKMLAQVNLPVDNLEIKGDRILVDGKAIDKLSTSEQIQFSLRVARAVAGKLKVICIDRFESLDLEVQKEFQIEASGDEFEYIVTIVTQGDLKMRVEALPA